MRIVSITIHGRELEKFVLSKQTLFIGRSPTADVILRARLVKPLHFVIEWLGSGAFDPNSGTWSIIDISGTSKKGASGEGMVLGSEGAKFGAIEFSFTKDELIESQLKKGVLSRSLDESVEGPKGSYQGGHCLEIVSFRKDLEKIENVSHYNFSAKETIQSPLKTYPLSSARWESPKEASLKLPRSSGAAQVVNRTELVFESLDQERVIKIGDQDIYFVQSEIYDYILRLVPRVRVPSRKSFHLDKTFFLLLLILVFLFSLSLILPHIPRRVDEVEIKERVARVEIFRPIEKVEEIPPLPEKIPDQNSLEVPKQVDSSVPKNQDESQKIKDLKGKLGAASQVNVSSPTEKQQAGLDVKSPPKKTNQLGVLGAIRAQGAGQAKSQVKADQILPGRPPSELDTQGSQTLVARTKPGVIAKSNVAGGVGSPGTTNLESASTTMKNSFVKNKSGSTVMATSQGSVLEKGLPKSDGKDLVGSPSVGLEDGGSVEVSGGLDRETVKNALKEYRWQIKNCFDRYLSGEKEKTLAGKLTFSWEITAAGDVIDTKPVHSDFKDSVFENCMKRILDRVIYPKAMNGQSTKIKYPWLFNQGTARRGR